MIAQKDWVKDLVIYQVYPRSFYDTDGDGVGDLPGVIAKLDYLQSLGVNALWLSPFFASPLDDNGYDISDYRAILPEYGTMEDCETLIRECHARGMKFIIDLVVNHSSDEHEWFEKSVQRIAPYTDYYYWADQPNNWASVFGGSAWEYHPVRKQYYMHFFSKKQPDLNWSCPELKQEIHDIVRWWAEKGVDGLRVDAISYLDKPENFPDAEGEPNPEGFVFPALLIGGPRNHAYLHECNEKLFTPLNLVTIGEISLLRDEELADYVSNERAEFDMAIPFLPPVAEYGQHVPTLLRERLIARYNALPQDGWWAQFMSNHDKPRQVSFFGDDGEFREISAKALAMVNHISPGTPFVYQGEELGMTSIHLDSIDDYDDIDTRNAYRTCLLSGQSEADAFRFATTLSRDNARTPMQWSDAPNAGFTTGKPWLQVNANHTAINAEAQQDDPCSILNFYRRLIALRRELPAIRDGALRMIDSHADVIAFARETAGQQLILVANLCGDARPLPEGVCGETVLQSYERDAGFDGKTLRPWEAVLLKA